MRRVVALAAFALACSHGGPPSRVDCPGAAWRALPTPAAAASDAFASVGGSGPTDVWFCSSAGVAPSVVAVHLVRFDGATPALAAVPPPPSCLSLWASGAGELWAGGAPHHVAHLVGGAWLDVNLDDQRPASGIWSNRADNVWIVGAGGYWAHWDGTQLTPRAAGGTAGTSVWGTGDDDLWTNSGHATAAGTVDLPSMTTGIVSANAVWAADDAHVWLVGDGGAIVRFDGSGWTGEPSGTSADLHAVWGSSSSDVWAVGAAGTIVHFDGARWSPVPAPTTASLAAVWGADACHLFAAGDGGALLAR